MDYKEALEYIAQIAPLGSRPGLERVSALLEKLGDPQNSLKIIHVAGTNGKGSCASMTASVLKTCGYRTGLFTSPHLVYYNERIQINGCPISNSDFAELITAVRPAADSLDDHPTEFEIITAAALYYFAQQKCDAVVLEVGLGGRLDATNAVASIEAAVIMNIGLDHTEILGSTVEQIAAEKAGIIKPGCVCVAYDQPEAVLEVIRSKCAETGVELIVSDNSALATEFDTIEGQVFTYKGQPFALSLIGSHQQKNAAVVIELAEALRARGWKLSPEDVEHGLYAVNWPARFEVVSDEPYFVVDGGHNPQCAETVAAALTNYFPGMRHVLLMGILADKDRSAVEQILAPVADEFICVTPDSPRALPAAALAEELRAMGCKSHSCDSIRDGVTEALAAAGSSGMVCSVGSLYMAGEVRQYFIPDREQE